MPAVCQVFIAHKNVRPNQICPACEHEIFQFSGKIRPSLFKSHLLTKSSSFLLHFFKMMLPSQSCRLQCRFRLIASVTIGPFWSWWLWGLSLCLSVCLSDRSCCWMEEWLLSLWVFPQGQLGEIIRQDSHRRTEGQTGRCSTLKLFLSDYEANFSQRFGLSLFTNCELSYVEHNRSAEELLLFIKTLCISCPLNYWDSIVKYLFQCFLLD